MREPVGDMYSKLSINPGHFDQTLLRDVISVACILHLIGRVPS